MFGVDQALKNGATVAVPFRQCTLMAMPEYADQSLEEIRLEDYILSSIHVSVRNTQLLSECNKKQRETKK